MTVFVPVNWFLQIVVYLIVGLAMRCSAMTTDDLEAVLTQTVTDAMHASHLTIKEAAWKMGIDEKQLRRQLNREPHQYLALVRLFRLPFAFWLCFTPALVALVYRKRMAEFAESINDMKRGA